MSDVEPEAATQNLTAENGTASPSPSTSPSNLKFRVSEKLNDSSLQILSRSQIAALLSQISFGITLLSRIAATVAYVLLLNGSIIQTDAPLHCVLDDCIEWSARMLSGVQALEQLRMTHLEHRVFSAVQPSFPSPTASHESVFKVLSENIQKHGQNLDMRRLRISLCETSPLFRQDQQKLLIALDDAGFIVQQSGKAEDWVGYALIQGQNGHDDWRVSLNRAKKLGFKFPKEEAAGTCNWVSASLRDSSYSHPHMLSWLEAVGQITDDHSLDFFIAKTYLHCGQYQKGIDTFSKMIREGTEKESLGYLYFWRGTCYKLLGDLAAAKKDFRETLEHLTKEERTNDQAAELFVTASRAVLGERSKKPVLENFGISAIVLYYVLAEEYERAVALVPDKQNYDSTVDEICRRVDVGPFDDSHLPFLDREVNVHLLRAYSFEQLKKAKESALEKTLAYKSIPENVRKELRIFDESNFAEK